MGRFPRHSLLMRWWRKPTESATSHGPSVRSTSRASSSSPPSGRHHVAAPNPRAINLLVRPRDSKTSFPPPSLPIGTDPSKTCTHCRRGGQLKLGAAAATVAPEHSRTHVRNPASSMPSSLERHPARRKERRLWLLISALATPREELRTKRSRWSRTPPHPASRSAVRNKGTTARCHRLYARPPCWPDAFGSMHVRRCPGSQPASSRPFSLPVGAVICSLGSPRVVGAAEDGHRCFRI